MNKNRKSYLLISDHTLLDIWCQAVSRMFKDHPYLVGSALQSKDYRDVDIRLILSDKDYGELDCQLELNMLNLAVSIWGQKATGLPIDFQIQQMTEANKNFKGPRNALGL